MKSRLSLLLFLSFCFFGALDIQAQCISSFPYTYNFENFTNFQTDASCDLAVAGDTADGWLQDLSDNADWRADTSGTPSIGTGPGSTDSTNGEGIGKDYSPGTLKGVYLYIEPSPIGRCDGTTANLLSPCFDLSDGKYYQVKLAYHMRGDQGMGTLFIDYFDGTSWIEVWHISGNQGDTWNVGTAKLGNVNKSSVQVRIRAEMGTSFLSDMAIDAFSVETYTPNKYDGVVKHVLFDQQPYTLIPLKHSPDLGVNVVLRNEGSSSITGVKVKSSATAYIDSTTFSSLSSFAIDTAKSSNKYKPQSLKDSVEVNLTLNEADADYTNNAITTIPKWVNDSVYAREDGNNFGGIGSNGGTIQIGQMFELMVPDTLRSISFLCNASTTHVGDSVKVHIYNYSGTAPGSKIATTKGTVRLTGNNQWYFSPFECEQILSAGKYFVAVEQINPNNMALGYTFKYYYPNTCFYGNGTTWTEVSSGGFDATIFIRMNFGNVKPLKVAMSLKDTLCVDEIATAEASGALKYTWQAPTGVVKAPSLPTTQVSAGSSFNITLTGTDNCGKSAQISKYIFVEQLPTATISPDTTVCKNKSVSLWVNSPNNNYKWQGGPANANYNVSSSTTKTYNVDIDSSNGCSIKKNVRVGISSPTPGITKDTSICESQPLNLKATGGTTYQWTGGPATATYLVRPSQTGTYTVQVIDDFNCSENASVKVTVVPGPTITTSADTSICFGNQITMTASGADAYEWISGPKTSSWKTFPLTTREYIVKGIASGGCFLFDTIHVAVASIPKVDVRNDTAICEGKSIVLTAATKDVVDFKWSNDATTQSITVTPKETKRYNVVVANTVGCSAEDSVLISVNPNPIMGLTWVLNKRDVTFTDKSEHGTSYSWDFGDGETSTTRNIFHKYTSDDTYTVKHSVTNDCGTKDTTFTIKIENLSVVDPDVKLFKCYPNPTSGSINLSFEGNEAGEVNIQVFNVNGKLIYSQTEQKLGSSFSTTLNLVGNTDGIYFIQMQTPDGVANTTVILQR